MCSVPAPGGSDGEQKGTACGCDCQNLESQRGFDISNLISGAACVRLLIFLFTVRCFDRGVKSHSDVSVILTRERLQ